MAAETTLESFPVNVRIKISALWASMLFVFVYVDLFSLYRRDFFALALRPRVDRIANIALGIVYVLTVIGGAIGEWGYYILGSVVEVVLLGAVVYYAWT